MTQGTGGFLQPQKVLEQLNINSGLKIADFGCGHGYFSIPLAQAVKEGVIYSFDVLAEALEALQSKAETANLRNIKTIRVNLEKPNGTKLENDSVDMVVMANILFQTQKKSEIIEEARRILKENGRIVILDWRAKSTMAPKEGWLISKEETIELAEIKGLKLKKELQVDENHYGLVFELAQL